MSELDDTSETLLDTNRWVDYAIFVVVSGLLFMVMAALINTVAQDSPGWIYLLGLGISGAIGYAAAFSGEPIEIPQENYEPDLDLEQ